MGGCHPRSNDERWSRRRASQQQDHQDPHQASVFTCWAAAEIANPGLASTATQDDAHQ